TVLTSSQNKSPFNARPKLPGNKNKCLSVANARRGVFSPLVHSYLGNQGTSFRISDINSQRGCLDRIYLENAFVTNGRAFGYNDPVIPLPGFNGESLHPLT